MKKDKPEEIPVLGTDEAETLINGVLRNLCAEGSRGDVVSKLVADGKLKLPDSTKGHKPVRSNDSVSRG